MEKLVNIRANLLLEQDSKLTVLRKSISERLPITINYTGPQGEVKPGQRIDIEPIVLGKNAKSGNLVIWAYVFKGVTKKGLPGWKMFRVDRITSAKFMLGAPNFKLRSLPGYEKGKAPNAMKSLSSVEIFSPYWFEDDKRFTAEPKPFPKLQIKKPEVKAPVVSEPKIQPTTPIMKPEISTNDLAGKSYNSIKPLIKDVKGQKVLSRMDYERALKDLYSSKEGEWKAYQRKVGNNDRPGEGTRRRFTNSSKSEMDNLLKRDNVNVTDDLDTLNEARKIQSRIKRLINW